MNIALWVVQVILAFVFLMAGAMKITRTKERLEEAMEWVEDFSGDRVRLIGALEVLAALGLVLPGLTGLWPWLTPVAATGLALLMLGAAYTHLRRGETPNILVNLVLLAPEIFVAYGRFSGGPLS